MKFPGSRTIRNMYGKILGAKTPEHWKNFSRLYVKSDDSDWVLDSVREEMKKVCVSLGIRLVDRKYGARLRDQCIFYTSKYEALTNLNLKENKIGFPMYHGNPSSNEESKYFYDQIKLNHQAIDRIQVSNSIMKEVIYSTGIDQKKVFQIPISLEIENFPFSRSFENKINRKKALGIDPNSFLIGSFQKDGQGWGAGNKPKLIKGPDIFLDVVERVKKRYPQIEILLTGPARGFVKNGLKKMNIKYHHFSINDFSNISLYYQSLDAYLVASREEGGPRSILESMASGIPLVTTRVGQAIDLVEHEKNAWMTEVNDVDNLVYWIEHIIRNQHKLKEILSAAKETAVMNSYSSQEVLWSQFMKGFVAT